MVQNAELTAVGQVFQRVCQSSAPFGSECPKLPDGGCLLT